MKTSDLQCPDEIARVDLARSKKTKMSQQKTSRHNHIAVRGGTSELTPFTIARHTVACERHPDRNEDCIIADEQSGLAAVFDGVGVHTPRLEACPFAYTKRTQATKLS